MAGRQGGVVSSGQLAACGVASSTISRWTAAGRLHRVHRGVYAVGHRALELPGRLHAALLYAGDGAALSHQTAAWAWGLVEATPDRIHATVAGYRRSCRGVDVHSRRQVTIVVHRGLPATSVAWTLLDLAAALPLAQLRRALANADAAGLLDVGELEALLGRGRPGSAALRRALATHLPQLAATRSELEERFLLLLEARRLPMPELNGWVEGLMVDCLWRDAGLVVELDGLAWHGGRIAVERDRERDLLLRRAGLRVLRYTWRQVTREAAAIAAELSAALAPNDAESCPPRGHNSAKFG